MFEAFCDGRCLLLLLLAIISALIFWYQQRREASHAASNFNLPPSMPCLPLIGSLPYLTKFEGLVDLFMHMAKRLGSVFTFYAGTKCIVVLNGKQAIHEALVTHAADFADRVTFPLEAMFNRNNKGIIFVPYNTSFKKYRQLCLSILKDFGFGKKIMENRIQVEVEEIVKEIRSLNGKPFFPRNIIMVSVANVMLNMLFGRRFCMSNPSFHQLMTDLTDSMTKVSISLNLLPVLRFLPYYRQVANEFHGRHERFFQFMNENIASCLQSDSESFVRSFVEAEGPNYDSEQLQYLVRDFMGAGMETTSTTLLWTLAVLANHRTVQNRLHAEIDSVIGMERLPELDDRPRLPFVEATILELMRYKTLVPFAILHATQCDTHISGYDIPAKTMVLVNLQSVHMDEDVWKDPQTFRPDRFLDSTGNVMNRDHILPFSLGKRSCLGEQLARQEIFLFLAGLLQQFDFCPPEGQDYIDVREKLSVVNAPSEYYISLKVRT